LQQPQGYRNCTAHQCPASGVGSIVIADPADLVLVTMEEVERRYRIDVT